MIKNSSPAELVPIDSKKEAIYIFASTLNKSYYFPALLVRSNFLVSLASLFFINNIPPN